MARFNLLDEKWILVMTAEKGESKEVSLLELFRNAESFKGLAGEMVAQDFAVFRILLAILNTVFSRFNAEGEKYEYIELDERYKQIEDVDEDDEYDYIEDLYDTWKGLWEKKAFPDIIEDYLLKWHDRFYLYDDNYPFFQVRKDDVKTDNLKRGNPSPISGKNINRLISESGNKIALFSPKSSGKIKKKNNKDYLSDSEVIRWLLTYQGYCGLSDKAVFSDDMYKRSDFKNSKGWLFDIGGVFLEGDNLFESLTLNLILVHPESQYILKRQKPSWEYSSKENLGKCFFGYPIDNLAELYTNWSRAIFLDPDHREDEPFEFGVVKLPEIDHIDNFLEPMTLFRYNKDGENKGAFTPKKHEAEKALWRNFGLVTISDEDKNMRKPGIIDWLNNLSDTLEDKNIRVRSCSLEDDGTAMSWLPVDEIFDSLDINDMVINDLNERGWVIRINEMVDLTKEVIDRVYRGFLLDIKEIRSLDSNDFVNQEVGLLFYNIDQPFREWLSSIKIDDLKDEKLNEWKKELKLLVLKEAEDIVAQAGSRDFTGIEKDGEIKNIATSFNKFIVRLNKKLRVEDKIEDKKEKRQASQVE